MSQYSAQGTVVKVGSTQIYANNVTVSTTKSIEAVRALGYGVAQGQSVSGPLETTISLDYYINANADNIKTSHDTIIANPISYGNGIGETLTVGVFSLDKCYLKSLSYNAEPNSLITASASYVSNSADGKTFNLGTTIAPATVADLKFSHGSNSTTSLLANSIGFSYECSFEWEPIIFMGKKGVPEQGMLFGGGTQTLTAKGVGVSELVKYCVASRTASFSIGTQDCNGSPTSFITLTNAVLSSVELASSVGGYKEGTVVLTKSI